MSANDARKQSLYFPDEMLSENPDASAAARPLALLGRAARLGKISKTELRKIPSPNDMLDDDPAAARK